ncbi:MAG TPA: TetR/AcrR family transcriptional regulator [Chthonomonadaceae bacterium]|nr:TetR/AcrR family transcriptional regulator [Chthonomonadaceae bacterium]
MASQPGSREKILQCASEMFYYIGYQATSVDDILAQSGVAKSNFYYHFKTKEQLAFEVLEGQAADFEAVLQQTIGNQALRPKERLERLFQEMCSLQSVIHKFAGCPFGNLAAALPRSENDGRSERFRVRLSQLFSKVENALRDCLAEGALCGDFRWDLSAEEGALLLLATLEGLMVLTKTYRDVRPLVRGCAALQRILCAE